MDLSDGTVNSAAGAAGGSAAATRPRAAASNMTRAGQVQRVREQAGRLPAGGRRDAAFQVTDRPGTEGRSLREFFLGQAGLGAELTQQRGK